MKRKFKCANDKSDVLIVTDVAGEKSMDFYIKGSLSSVVLDLNDLKSLYETIGRVIRR